MGALIYAALALILVLGWDDDTTHCHVVAETVQIEQLRRDADAIEARDPDAAQDARDAADRRQLPIYLHRWLGLTEHEKRLVAYLSRPYRPYLATYRACQAIEHGQADPTP